MFQVIIFYILLDNYFIRSNIFKEEIGIYWYVSVQHQLIKKLNIQYISKTYKSSVCSWYIYNLSSWKSWSLTIMVTFKFSLKLLNPNVYNRSKILLVLKTVNLIVVIRVWNHLL